MPGPRAPLLHHPSAETLDRLVDGELRPEAAAPVERHVAACPACADVVARLERLRRVVARAPRELAPPEDLWPAVRAQLADATLGGAALAGVGGAAPRALGRPSPGPAARRGWARQRLAVAAGMLLVAAGGALVARPGLEVREVPARTGQPAVAWPTATPVAAPPADQSSAQLGAVLAAELRARRGQFAPETIAAAEQNLRDIDAAVEGTRRALAADPDNVHLEQMLARASRQRADYVRTTLALADGR